MSTKKTILDDTNHMLYLFRHLCGESEVPQRFYDWTFLTAIAAAVQDRVWVEKFEGDRLTPNLYTFLVGPSGLGKSTAIKRVMPFLNQLDNVPSHIGPITGAALNALLAGSKNKPGMGKILLIQDELAMCIGSGEMAFDFIKALTGIYSPTAKMQKATLSGGLITIKNASINWVAGTTVEWMVKTIPREAIKGGFIGRLFPVCETYNYNKRVPRPTSPPDAEEVREHLMVRFQQLANLKGKMKLTKKARAVLDHWYMTRPEPENDNMASIWQRQHDMVYKVSTIYSLCVDYSLVIKSDMVSQAIEDVSRAEEDAKVVIRAADATETSDVIDVVRRIILRSRYLPESALMKECTKRGISKRAMNDALDALETERAIHFRTRKLVTGSSQRWIEAGKAVGSHLKAVK